jgi:Secretion system C-terminal sorting domain
MSKLLYTFSVFLFLLLPITQVFGQHEMVIPDFLTNGKYLNDEIDADTLANGQRTDTNRVYVLNRGGLYELDGALDNNGYSLNIVSDGNSAQTEKPVIILEQNPTTSSYPGYFVKIDGDIYLKDITVVGIPVEGDTASMSHIPGNILSTNSAGWNITIDSCIMSDASGDILRTASAANNIKLTNDIFANLGYLGTSNLGAGKGVDLRNGSVDTLLIQNCTFVNLLDRTIRHLSSTAALNVVIFDHNTIVNSLAYHGLLSLGWVGSKVQITNNLFQDPFAFGNDTDATRQVEFVTHETDPYTGQPNRMVWIFTDTTGGGGLNGSTQFIVSNNYYTISDSGQAFYNRYYEKPGGLPQEFNLPPEGSPLSWYINKHIADSTTAFTKDDNIKLTDVPRLATNLMDWYRSPTGGNKTKNTPTNLYNIATDNYDMKPIQYYADTLNCTYSTSAPAYTGAMNGFPAGDLNWFPNKKSQWMLTGIKDEPVNNIPNHFSLNQNYPNPFNPSTRISFNISRTGFTTLTVYNVLGEKVATLISGNLQAGYHVVNFNASNLSSGIYLYRLESGNSNSVKKMILMK